MANPLGKRIKRPRDPGSVIQALFADLASVLRMAESGHFWSPIGAISAATIVGESTPVMIYNASGATAYVSFGDQAMAAPTGATDGIPILNGEKFVVNSGSYRWARASAANVFAYRGDVDPFPTP